MERAARWTDKEIKILKETYKVDSGITSEELLQRSKKAIETKAYRLNLVGRGKGSLWSENEVQLLKKYYPIEGGDIVNRLPVRTRAAILRKAQKLGVKIKAVLEELGNVYGDLTVISRAPNKNW